MNAQEVKQELNTIKSVLFLVAPFVSSLLARCRIVLDPAISKVCVNAAQELRINPEFIAQLGKKERTALFAEQALHIALQHARRMQGKDAELFNIAACASVYALLDAHMFLSFTRFPKGAAPITAEHIARLTQKDPKEIANMTAEEIYQLLKQCQSSGTDAAGELQHMHDLSGEGKNESKGNSDEAQKTTGKQKPRKDSGSVVQEGDPRAYGKKLSPKDQKAYWDQALVQAYMEAKKIAGTVPAGLEREIGELFRPHVPWLSEINKALADGIGKTAISTWTRTSRKHPMLAGNRFLTVPRIWSAIDGSASVDKKELTHYLSIVALHAKVAQQAIVLPWDADVYEPIVLRKPSDAVQKLATMPGGGGTQICPALLFLKEKMRPGDLVVIITDGHIFDLDDEETQSALRAVAKKSGVAIFASNDKLPDIPRGWRKIKIEPTPR